MVPIVFILESEPYAMRTILLVEHLLKNENSDLSIVMWYEAPKSTIQWAWGGLNDLECINIALLCR